MLVAGLQGWRCGLLRSLIVPISLCIAWLISILYFDSSYNVLKSIWLILFITFILSFIGHLGLSLGRRSLSDQEKLYVFWGSRILGTAVNAAWQSIIFFFLIAILQAALPHSAEMKNIKEDIKQSRVYHWMGAKLLLNFPVAHATANTLAAFADQEQMELIKLTPEYKAVFDDPKVQELLSDPEISEYIQKKNVVRLMQAEKVRTILKDEEIMKKFSRLTRMVYKQYMKVSPRKEESKNQ
jgi:hypothetical protein